MTDKVERLVVNAEVLLLASITEDGYPRPVAMAKLSVDDKIIYFSTGTSSNKTAHFKANPKAGVAVVEGMNTVTYIGEIEIVEDKEIKDALWIDWLDRYFQEGKDDPEYTVMKFTPKSGIYYIDGEFVREDKINL